MKRFAAAVVGLGGIGQGYDYDNDELVLTHARAFARHPGFDLVAGVDPDSGQRRRFEKRYGLPAFADCAALFTAARPEVLALSVPTAQHAAAFREILGCRPRAVLCEKPLAGSLEEAKAMVRDAAAANCALAVNFVRRTDPGARDLKLALDAGGYGSVFKGVAWYSKGLRNNGIHLIDLLRFLLGEATEVYLLVGGRKWQDIDPEPDFRLRFGYADIYVLAAREECFSRFGVELLATGGRIAYSDGGDRIGAWPVVDDPVFGGYRRLAPQESGFGTDMGRYQLNALESLYQHLCHGTELASDGASAVRSQELVEKIINLCETA